MKLGIVGKFPVVELVSYPKYFPPFADRCHTNLASLDHFSEAKLHFMLVEVTCLWQI